MQAGSALAIQDRPPVCNSPAKRPEQQQNEDAQLTQAAGISPSATMSPIALPTTIVRMTEKKTEIFMKDVKAKRENAVFCFVRVGNNKKESGPRHFIPWIT